MLGKLIQPIYEKQQQPSVKSTFRPGLSFFSLLQKLETNSPIYVRITETLVCGYGFKNPTLLYSTKSGILQWNEDATWQEIIEFFEFVKSSVDIEWQGHEKPLFLVNGPDGYWMSSETTNTELYFRKQVNTGRPVVVTRFLLPPFPNIVKKTLTYSQNRRLKDSQNIRVQTVVNQNPSFLPKVSRIDYSNIQAQNQIKKHAVSFIETVKQKIENLVESCSPGKFDKLSIGDRFIINGNNQLWVDFEMENEGKLLNEFKDLVRMFTKYFDNEKFELISFSAQYLQNTNSDWHLVKIDNYVTQPKLATPRKIKCEFTRLAQQNEMENKLHSRSFSTQTVQVIGKKEKSNRVGLKRAKRARKRRRTKATSPTLPKQADSVILETLPLKSLNCSPVGSNTKKNLHRSESLALKHINSVASVFEKKRFKKFAQGFTGILARNIPDADLQDKMAKSTVYQTILRQPVVLKPKTSLTPIFNFPTPRNLGEDDDLAPGSPRVSGGFGDAASFLSAKPISLKQLPYHDRIRAIQTHIVRSNQGFTRVHFEESVKETRFELAADCINKSADQLDKLKRKIELPPVLRQVQSKKTIQQNDLVSRFSIDMRRLTKRIN